MKRLAVGFFTGDLFVLVLLFVSCTSVEKNEDFPPREKVLEYIIAFGDIQMYTYNDTNIKYYESSLKWIQERMNEGKKVSCILQYGDVTETNAEEEWIRFNTYTSGIASIVPFFVCVGNHDYDRTPQRYILGRNTTRINEYASFPLTRNSIVAYYENERLENYVAAVSICGREVFILSLEFAARTEVLQWAIDYVDKHKDRLFILMTHEWLSDDGKRRVTSDSYGYWQIGTGSSFSTPEQIWNTLVWPNNNIVCVVCGHNVLAGTLYSKNKAGRDVPQILLDTQKLDYGGDGIIQIWQFDNVSDSVKVYAYDSIREKPFKPDTTSLSFPFFIF